MWTTSEPRWRIQKTCIWRLTQLRNLWVYGHHPNPIFISHYIGYQWKNNGSQCKNHELLRPTWPKSCMTRLKGPRGPQQQSCKKRTYQCEAHARRNNGSWLRSLCWRACPALQCISFWLGGNVAWRRSIIDQFAKLLGLLFMKLKVFHDPGRDKTTYWYFNQCNLCPFPLTQGDSKLLHPPPPVLVQILDRWALAAEIITKGQRLGDIHRGQAHFKHRELIRALFQASRFQSPNTCKSLDVAKGPCQKEARKCEGHEVYHWPWARWAGDTWSAKQGCCMLLLKEWGGRPLETFCSLAASLPVTKRHQNAAEQTDSAKG